VIRRAALLAVLAMVTTSCAVLGFPTSCDGTELIGYFEEVGDLVENANVQSSDVEIGTVSNIELDGWTAEVTMCINEGENIPEDTNAVIRTTSLLGEKFVDMRPQSEGPPYLADGDTIDLDRTSKATELEEVFAKLAAILGTGNLEQINRFTTAQAEILRGRAPELRELLSRLRQFTDVLNENRGEIAVSVDSLDSVARTVLDDSAVLENFLDSFAGSSKVLADQKDQLQDLVIALDEFSRISIHLMETTEAGLDQQFRDLRPVLRTAVANSENLHESLRTLATFTEWFPETMPGDYLQLDVCQAPPEHTAQGVTCQQNVQNDDPSGAPTGSSLAPDGDYSNAVQYLLHLDAAGGDR
jgi:phospholipid/cholesterol/gamma-HCH transport system substrate-binding protein